MGRGECEPIFDIRGQEMTGDRPATNKSSHAALPIALVGDDVLVPCGAGEQRPYLNLDMAASTNALPAVAQAVREFLPWYSSVHRGAGHKSRYATRAYEDARTAALGFAGRRVDGDDIAIVCRNTTEAINHLAYRLRLEAGDTIVTTVVEHHANLLPWKRFCQRRFVECRFDGTFDVDDVIVALDGTPRPKLLTLTAASNVTGWMPPVDDIIDAAHARGIPVLVDAAQLAPHRRLPATADFLAWSGHKMYAPFGAGILLGPRQTFTEGDPFLAGGGAVDLVDLDEVVWTDPPEREEAGSPNVVGAVALGTAIGEFGRIGWNAIEAHDSELSARLRRGLAEIAGVHVLGPDLAVSTLPLATFTVAGLHHALVAARLSAEYGIGVRHGCFCAHPYLLRLLRLSSQQVAAYRTAVLAGDRRAIPGAVRASAGISTSIADIDRLLAAVRTIASGDPAPFDYEQDPNTGDFGPVGAVAGWGDDRSLGASCARG
jgi:selenocysteine lyase/cysteine desulfurase